MTLSLRKAVALSAATGMLYAAPVMAQIQQTTQAGQSTRTQQADTSSANDDAAQEQVFGDGGTNANQAFQGTDTYRRNFSADRMDDGTSQGRVAKSSVGEAGQRESLNQQARIRPMARIDSRIDNRIESRIRNRIDRDYDPEANAKSPFKVATDQDSKSQPQM